MARKPNLLNRVLVINAVLFSLVFAFTMVSRAIIAQNNTDREIEKIKMNLRIQCRQWLDENKEKVLKIKKEDINCNWNNNSFEKI
ncbi:MAG: hypothetical protein IGR93_09680 [Hydrococcus sp. C42_A2020_068]|uniref:hypothetical protein n=1 Tax=Pleurocapsa sp. PCC 7327 TaxID=118163 RepID=UPI00029FC50B|nr:hypothetical protein [Pleurocapsa sp. PCC 7327]AFY78298.1 hypothetical protein Ple7327_3068 [Pleurocapsa sp. PCC 7327]MBF2020353.1 hypothetical protein [Hydrococcus sp. C42_A2020_068]